MICRNRARILLLSLALAAGSAAFAQVRFNIQVGPPAPVVEQVPAMAPGYVWAPGYWAWHGDRHIWIHGRTIVQRVGYRWQPDVWEQRNNTYYRHPGQWQRDRVLRPAPRARMDLNPGRGNKGDGPGNGKRRGNNKRQNDKHDGL